MQRTETVSDEIYNYPVRRRDTNISSNRDEMIGFSFQNENLEESEKKCSSTLPGNKGITVVPVVNEELGIVAKSL